MKDESPVSSRPRRFPLIERNIIDEQVHKWLAEGIIEETETEIRTTEDSVEQNKFTNLVEEAVAESKLNKMNVKTFIGITNSISSANSATRKFEIYDCQINVYDTLKSKIEHVQEQKKFGITRKRRNRQKDSQVDNITAVMVNIPLKRSTPKQTQLESEMQRERTVDQQIIVQGTLRKVTKSKSSQEFGLAKHFNEENHRRTNEKLLKKLLREAIIEVNDEPKTPESSSQYKYITQTSCVVKSRKIEKLDQCIEKYSLSKN